MAVRQSGSVVEVRNSAAGNSHVSRCDDGPSNVFVHFERAVQTGNGVERMSIADLDQFVGMAVRTAPLSLRRIEEHDDGWMVVFKKD